MPQQSPNAYEKKATTFDEWVWFEGTTALLEGQSVCYNWDYNRASGSAASAYPERFNRVEVPSITNAQYFAGVTAEPYRAVSPGPQLIKIYRPGSVCNVLSGASTTIGEGRLTCEITGTVATNGYFRYSGLEGEGSCIPFQTIDRGTPGLCLAKLDIGRPSGLLEVVTATAGAQTGFMVGGTTLFVGASLGSDETLILADATRDGLRKKYGIITNDISGGNNLVVTVSTGRMHVDGDTTLATITFTASASSDTSIVLEWDGAWGIISCSKTQPVIA